MFSQLGLSPTACASLAGLGYTAPTPIQTDAIPLVLRGVDLLARAQTGTGKTAAFGLPMIERLMKRDTHPAGRLPRGLVLVPTRELAVQVHQALATYAASTPVRVAAVFGGVAMNGQVQVLDRGVDIVVATPGRLIDHLQRRTVDLSAIEVLTLDEADRMLDMGFLPALRRVVAALPRRRQTLLFSATLSEDIIRLSTEFTCEALRVDVSPRQVVATTVTHQVHEVAVDRKCDILTHILTQHGTVKRSCSVGPSVARTASATTWDSGACGQASSMATRARAPAVERSPTSRRGACVSWWPLTSPPAASTSRICRWSSTLTCRSCRRATCIASVARAAPVSQDAPCRW